MPEIDRISSSPEETTELGRELARRLTAPMLILLSGDLGSGKTTLTKGIISGLGAAREEDVTSPTFTLVHVFRNHAENPTPDQAGNRVPAQANQAKIYHVDLYRVEDFHDLETLALEDALSEPAIVIIEWSERFSLRSDWPRIVIRLEHLEGDTRHIVITEPTPANSTPPHV